ncbi:Cupredoxin [Dichotomocladium elegans]|nr:Cupredoxin [Dichotomocladium elegans]
MYFFCAAAALCCRLLLVASQSTHDPEYDPPGPYIHHPVDYVGDFKTLHEELEQPMDGIEREYFVAAEEIIWDYTEYSGSSANDDSYSIPKPRPQWQGLMGPILRAEVGDTIKVHFFNRAAHNFSMHPHGVFYEFEMEGAVYKAATEFSMIEPGHNYTYEWKVMPRAGPGPSDGNSLVWGYHSHVSENDIFAGLFGAIVVYRKGALRESTIKNEVVTALVAINENISPYLTQTVTDLAHDIDFNAIKMNQTAHAIFRRSNIKQSINGIMMAQPNDLVLQTGTTYDWHLLGWGSVKDMPRVSWEHGDVSLNGRQISQIRLLPATFKTVQLKADTSGFWQFGYLTGAPGPEGMTMWYTVEDLQETKGSE